MQICILQIPNLPKWTVIVEMGLERRLVDNGQHKYLVFENCSMFQIQTNLCIWQSRFFIMNSNKIMKHYQFFFQMSLIIFLKTFVFRFSLQKHICSSLDCFVQCGLCSYEALIEYAPILLQLDSIYQPPLKIIKWLIQHW